MTFRRPSLITVRCLLVGHEDREVRDPQRLFLRCSYCGRETPGWSLVTTRRPRPLDTPRRSGRLPGLTWIRSAAHHGRLLALFRWLG